MHRCLLKLARPIDAVLRQISSALNSGRELATSDARNPCGSILMLKVIIVCRLISQFVLDPARREPFVAGYPCQSEKVSYALFMGHKIASDSVML